MPAKKKASPPAIAPAPEVLASAFAAYQQNPKGPADRVLVAYYQDPRVRRIVEHNVRAFRIPDLKEEVWQRLAEIFWQKLLPALLQSPQDADNVYKVVFAGARHVSMSVRKERARDAVRNVSTDDPDEDMILTLAEQVQSEDFTDNVNQQIDQEYAGRELRRRLSMNSSDHQVFPLVTITESRPAVVPRKKPKAVPVDSEAGKELAAIRAKLGITNSTFASRLGIGLPTLSSYLYNRVQNVPERVMTAARAMIADGPTDFDRSTRLFGDVPMSDVVARWDKALSIEGNPDADKHIAFALKVDPITVWRWRTNAAQPDVAEIATLDRRINKFASLQSDSN